MPDDEEPRPDHVLRDWLRQLKAESGASYEDIGRAIGEDSRNVKRWMPENPTAKVTVPGGFSLLRLLDYFGVELNPPAPREVALSLMGELREIRASIEQGDGAAVARLESLRRRLEELGVAADEAREVTARTLKEIAGQIEHLSERLPPEEQLGQEELSK